METFKDLELPSSLQQSLDKLQFTKPTPIQAQSIPIAMTGKDILGSAQTGTGKTLAFGIPLITHLMQNKNATGLVIAPTRELATQISRALHDLLANQREIKSVLLIGGESIHKQLRQLRVRPRLFVGTPGRINDHLSRGTLKLDNAEFLVLDETDRMLDMGFSIQIEEILKSVPTKHQTLLFSATLPHNIVKLSATYLKDPARVAIGNSNNPVEKIKQDVIRVSEKDKYSQLVSQIDKRDGSIIVFVKTKIGAERMAKRLRSEHTSADAIHGNLRHNKREQVIKAFRNRKYQVLVATDVASRGLDIPHIEHVINYDLPQCPEDYIHRIGRTARAGAEGEAICFVTPADRGKWGAIDRLINPNAKPASAKPARPQRNKRRFGGTDGKAPPRKTFKRRFSDAR